MRLLEHLPYIGWFVRREASASGTLAHAENGKTIPPLDRTPDKPEPFGYKTSWFALKTSDPASVVETLGLTETMPANWASGLAAAYESSQGSDPWLFISPPVNGWVFAVNLSLPYPTVETQHDVGQKFDTMFSRLMEQFDEVQFFGSYRVSDFAAWARGVKGEPLRAFSWFDGRVLLNIGNQSSEEAKLGLPDLSGLSPSAAADKIFSLAEEQNAEEERLVADGLPFEEAHAKVRRMRRHALPTEDGVVELAALWSVDPTKLAEQDHPRALGLVVRLPESMQQ